MYKWFFYSQVKELDRSLVDVGNTLRNMEVNETKASEKEELYSQRLNDMRSRYNEVKFIFKNQNHFIRCGSFEACELLTT